MSIRWKILVIFLILALAPMMMLRWNGQRSVREMGATMAEEARNRIIQRTAGDLTRFIENNRGMLAREQRFIESALRIQALEIEKRLAGMSAGEFASSWMPKASEPAALTACCLSGNCPCPQPDGTDTRQLYRFFGKAPPPSLRSLQGRLNDLPKVFRQPVGPSPEIRFWRVSAFSNGLQTLFPAPQTWPKEFDFFGFDLYRQVTEEGGVIWTPAVSVSLTGGLAFITATPLRVDGQTVGATAIIISVDAFLNGNQCLRSLPGDVAALLIQMETGEGDAAPPAVHLVARRSNEKSGWRTTGIFPEAILENPQEMAGMIAHVRSHETTAGVSRTSEHLVAYGCMDGCRTVMVLKVPLREAIAEADALKERILAGTRRLLDRNGVILWSITAIVSILALFMSGKVTAHIRQLAHAAREVARGSLEQRVRIRTGDELESLGQAFNEMTGALKRQMAMQSAMAAAREIQQNLLPCRPPQIKGLDIAGKSLYCDATGGDYFDYMDFDEVCCRSSEHITIAVGDVSGHGVPAALLMASVRSLLRSRLTHRGDLGAVVTDVNRLMVRDTADTTQFMTLFLMDIHPGNRTVEWVRAGHEPALVYVPNPERFEWFNGKGVALGVCEDAVYTQSVNRSMECGQVILIGTDGIWETVNSSGEMFGRERLTQIIRENHRQPASVILDAVIAAVDDYRGTAPRQDDMTLVVVKFPELSMPA